MRFFQRLATILPLLLGEGRGEGEGEAEFISGTSES